MWRGLDQFGVGLDYLKNRALRIARSAVVKHRTCTHVSTPSARTMLGASPHSDICVCPASGSFQMLEWSGAPSANNGARTSQEGRDSGFEFGQRRCLGYFICLLRRAENARALASKSRSEELAELRKCRCAIKNKSKARSGDVIHGGDLVIPFPCDHICRVVSCRIARKELMCHLCVEINNKKRAVRTVVRILLIE